MGVEMDHAEGELLGIGAQDGMGDVMVAAQGDGACACGWDGADMGGQRVGKSGTLA